MTTEPPPVHAEHAHRSAPAAAGTVKDLAEVIAGQIAAQQALGADITGEFDVDIVYNKIEYKLKIQAPEDGTQEDPGFWIASGTRTDLDTNQTFKFLDCAFQDSSNWKVGLGLPVPITFTNGEIKHLWGEFQMGTVPPTGDGRPEVEA
jgi:hypothetical protein